MTKFIRVMDAINHVIKIICIAGFMVLLVVSLLQVFVRELSTWSVPWTDELSRFLIVYLVYFGAAIAARDNSLIRLEFFPTLILKVNEKGLWRFYVISVFFTVVFAVVCILGGVHIISISLKTMSPALNISMSIPYMAIPVGGVLISLNSFAHIFEQYMELKTGGEEL